MVKAEQIKSLRDKTGVSFGVCKKALEDASGDEIRALEILKEAGEQFAAKKSARTLGAGRVAAYVHSDGSMGAIVCLSTETDFVANNPEFISLADDLAMQVAATMPDSNEALLAGQFLRDPSKTIDQVIKESIQKFGERIEVSSFSRLDAKNQ